MKAFIFISIFTYILISSQSSNLLTIDLVFNSDNFYRIKNIDKDIQFSFNNVTNISLMPNNYINLIKLIFINKKILFNCFSKIIYMDEKYQTFSCERYSGYKDIDKIKLNFNFNNFNISIKGTELFSKQGNIYTFNFYTNNNILDVVLSNELLK